MCEFSHKDSVLIDISEDEALLGNRFWKLKRGGLLTSLYQNFVYASNKVSGPIPDLEGDLGFYSCNYNNYNNYNNYHNNNNYSYYSYNYNYNNYYYDNYYSYYIVVGITKSFGKVVKHDLGYRAEKIKIIALFTLKNHCDKNFLESFNSLVEKTASHLNVKTIPFQFGESIPSE